MKFVDLSEAEVSDILTGAIVTKMRPMGFALPLDQKITTAENLARINADTSFKNQCTFGKVHGSRMVRCAPHVIVKCIDIAVALASNHHWFWVLKYKLNESTSC